MRHFHSIYCPLIMVLTDATRDEAIEVFAHLAETHGTLDGLDRATFARDAIAALAAVRKKAVS